MPISLTLRRLLTTQPIDLQVFHPIAIQLVHLLETHDFTIDRVIELASEDQALAGSILKVANSTVYIGRVRTETIKDAVIRLGANHVSNLAMAASHAGLHASSHPVINDFMQLLWQHSYACAVGARELAQITRNGKFAEQAYMAGLLHDVGKLYLLKALERLNSLGVAQAALERELLLEIFMELHVEQGVRVMQHWNIPEIYTEVASKHHTDSFDEADTLLTIVRLANRACRFRGIGLDADETIDLFEEPEAEILQLEEDELEQMLDVMEKSKEVQLP